MSIENEYREIFLAEALENHTELNRLLTSLEKNPSDKKAVQAIFRITHTLKGNALGMGYEKIAEIAHTLEDLFGMVREERIAVDENILPAVYKAIDVLGDLVHAVKSGKEVRYKGIKTKLEVIIRNQNEMEKNESPVPTHSENNPTSSLEISDLIEDPLQDFPADNRIAFSDLVQIPVRKLDNLLNLVSELVIEKDRFMVTQRNLTSEFARLNRITSDLQYSVMDVRLVQVGFLFNRFHRIVRDAASLEKKTVNLKLEGADTEIDRNILQVISDSLIHLIRNSIGHGIEVPEERVLSGKLKEGTITLKAFSDADAVIISIEDDGRGIDIAKIRSKAIDRGLIAPETALQLSDDDIISLIFEAGFSTADQITEISGRGVGMDVVKKALDSIGGNIHVTTEAGKGSSFRLTLPASMAVKSTLLFELGFEQYAIPLSYTEAVISIYAKEIHRVAGGLVGTYLNKSIPLVFLKDLFNAVSEGPSGISENLLQRSMNQVHPEQKLEIVVVNHNGRKTGFIVDKLLQQKEIIEKQLARPVDKISFIGGATILGNGKVCLVLNVAMMMNWISTYNAKNRAIKV